MDHHARRATVGGVTYRAARVHLAGDGTAYLWARQGGRAVLVAKSSGATLQANGPKVPTVIATPDGDWSLEGLTRPCGCGGWGSFNLRRAIQEANA